ncbi:PAS/PAC sensor hybrid histidine kinase [Caballeronia udeis]|uniref:PAS/PAC sensor hybrid histidine kinase n=1 Tax=Caballeronia udeis TaxID=1232866 RepID=A0A158IQ41_9BURK|nr:response regulator [Caballeronia udeis]SAL58792.1 PAS/PAC sensor hybrid histidine kinase [Caballeronia udeis]
MSPKLTTRRERCKFSARPTNELPADDGTEDTCSMRKTQTIPLVDDDRSILVAWKCILQLEGYRIETASDGETALAAANKVQPVLVITDRSMPGMDGIELCHRLRREPKLTGIPVVLASASHEITVSAPVWDELWQRPVSVETMLASMRRLVALSP